MLHASDSYGREWRIALRGDFYHLIGTLLKVGERSEI